MNLEKKQKLLSNDYHDNNVFDLTKKHRCFLRDDMRRIHNNPIINNFNSINYFSHIVKKDKEYLYCADGFQFPYEGTTEIDINGDTYTVYDIYEIDDESSNVPSIIFEDLKDDMYLYSRDKRDISIHKVYKSMDRKEIYIIPFAGYSLEGCDIINLLINVKMHQHKNQSHGEETD